MGIDIKGSTARQIPTQYDNRGNPVWRSLLRCPDGTHGQCNMVPDRVIPVIFVPGVMGSNLIEKGKDPESAVKWRLDSELSLLGWLLRGPKQRKQHLTPDAMEVDSDGALPDGLGLPAEELKRRGWGEIAAMSYQPILSWLEQHLNDFDDHRNGQRILLQELDLGAMTGEAKPTADEIGLTYRYRFPVYACGYNWLASNADSGLRLSKRIDEIIDRYKKEKKKVEKVIIVTHSMGGLVARHCSEVLGRTKDILGIVHGVMPAIGAAAVYRRFKSGTENIADWFDPLGRISGRIASEVLGGDAAEMTAVMSTAPGPAQLLPTPEYGNGWLRIRDGALTYSFPQNGDPYGEIYTVRGKWWSMCEDHLINPLNEESNPKKRRARMNMDWQAYAAMIKAVKAFHNDVQNAYHPNTYAFIGVSEKLKAYGNVVWTGNGVSWLRGERKADILNARALDPTQVSRRRTVAAPLDGDGWLKAEHQTYKISNPDEAGDGTVPRRSGMVPKDLCKSFAQVVVEHEPAYKPGDSSETLRACQFMLRAVVKIAQDVQQTSLRYD